MLRATTYHVGLISFKRPRSQTTTANLQRQLSSLSSQIHRPAIHRRGDHPHGSREYLLCQPLLLTTIEHPDITVVQGHDDLYYQVLATLKAYRNTIYGATSKLKKKYNDKELEKAGTVEDDKDSFESLTTLCPPLVYAALEDCQEAAVGEQPQALAALYGLCDYVGLCLDGEVTSPALDMLHEFEREAVQAVATGVPRLGNSVVGVKTHKDAARGWTLLAREYEPLAAECQLYRSLEQFSLIDIELLADKQPAYLKTAGGAMARYYYTGEEKSE